LRTRNCATTLDLLSKSYDTRHKSNFCVGINSPKNRTSVHWFAPQPDLVVTIVVLSSIDGSAGAIEPIIQNRALPTSQAAIGFKLGFLGTNIGLTAFQTIGFSGSQRVRANALIIPRPQFPRFHLIFKFSRTDDKIKILVAKTGFGSAHPSGDCFFMEVQWRIIDRGVSVAVSPALPIGNTPQLSTINRLF
jgi:hypothetical protein